MRPGYFSLAEALPQGFIYWNEEAGEIFQGYARHFIAVLLKQSAESSMQVHLMVPEGFV